MKNVTEIIIGDLWAWTEYDFFVTASSNQLESESAVTRNITDPYAPCPPGEITVYQTTRYSFQPTLRVNWTKPNCTNGPLDGYEIYWKRIDGEQENNTVVNGSKTYIEIGDLEPWTEYTFSMFAFNQGRDGPLKSKIVNQSKKTDQSEPCPPNNITLYQKDFTADKPILWVEWSEPNCTNGPLDGYEVYWKRTDSNQEPKNKTVDGSTTFIEVDDLEPWTEYELSVLAYNQITDRRLRGGAVNRTIRTHLSAPCPPDNITIYQNNSIDAQSVLWIGWTKPNCTNGPLDGYEIYWLKKDELENNKTIDGNITFIEVENIEPWTNYTFFLLAFNRFDNKRLKSEKVNVSFRTEPSEPCAPSEITIHQTNPNNAQPILMIKWKEPNCMNGPLDGYEVYWGKRDNDSRSNQTVSGNVTSIEVRSLEPWTEYIFFVLAFNEVQDKRRRSTEVNKIFITDPSEPGRPTNLTLTLDETNMHAEWSIPLPTNGDISGYNISLKEGQCGSNRSDNEWITIKEREYFFSDMNAATNYSFSIYAFIEWKKIFLSGPTLCLQFRTSDGHPSAPSDVTCVEASNDSITVSWGEPALSRGDILNYTISYWRDEQSPIRSDVLIFTSNASLVIENLDPCTRYQIRISAWTSRGQGNWSIPVKCRTADAIPNSPAGVYATAIDSETIRVKWNRSTPYLCSITYTVVTDKLPSCKPSSGSNVINIPAKRSKFYEETEIKHLEPYTKYRISVIAKTTAGKSEATFADPVRTLPSQPSAVEKMELDCSFSSNKIFLSWMSPSNPNGVIEYYQIQYTGNRVGKTTDKGTKKIEEKGDACESRNVSVHIDNLLPEYNYEFSVSAKVTDVASYGPPVTKGCTLPAGFPPPARKNITVIESLKETIVFRLQKDTFSDTKGDIIEYAVVVAEADNIGSRDGGERNSEKLPNWSEFQKNESVLRYQATPENWNPFNDLTEEDPLKCFPETKGKNVKKCTLGCQLECDEDGYCNGPLKPGMSYGFKIRGYTKTGFAETWPVFINTKSEPKNSMGSIVTAVLVPLFVLIAILAGIFLFRRYGTVRAHQLILRLSPRGFVKSTVMPRASPSPNNDIVFAPAVTHTRPVKLNSFSKHVSFMMADSALKFSQEFEELKSISPSHPSSAAMLPDNRCKNRWINILPFDHSRVKLLPVDDEPASDYINSSYIPGFTCHREYIATQGPLPGTVDDMWRMIWEQGVNMIVMLTQCVERGKTKCEQYWPAEKQNATYGDLKVHTMSESVLSDYTIRIFDLSLGSRHRVITHLHFTKWPDFGCPENTELLINFVRAVRDHLSEGDPNPLIVHCSAGVGRTGTFIAVDRLMQHIILQDYADVFQTVLDMREHRTNMVQTEDQYIYIHECVRDLIQEKLARSRDSFKDDDDIYGNAASLVTTNI